MKNDILKKHIYNFKAVSDEIAVGGAVSDAGLKLLKQNGINSVIDLRTFAENTEAERLLLAAENLPYYNIQVGPAGISEAMIKEFNDVLSDCQKPVLIHCASGYRVDVMLNCLRTIAV